MEENRKQELEKLEAELKALMAERDDVLGRINRKEREIDVLKNPMRHIKMTVYFDSKK